MAPPNARSYQPGQYPLVFDLYYTMYFSEIGLYTKTQPVLCQTGTEISPGPSLFGIIMSLLARDRGIISKNLLFWSKAMTYSSFWPFL